MPSVVRLAPAKINLYLHVTGRRADGHHLLDSLVAFAEIADRIEVAEADRLSLAIDGPFAPALVETNDNLVLQAARLLAEAVGRPAEASIRLSKRLPVAAGIGGGSADAAATLKALMRVWRIDRRRVDLPALGAQLGADIPVCLAGQTSYFGGVGAEVVPAPALPEVGLVLVNPLVPLPTKTVFQHFEGRFTRPARWSGPATDARALVRRLAERGNDLTRAAVEAVPVVAEMLARLQASEACLLARMSGSGATVFGLYADLLAARRAAASLKRASPSWWIQATRFRRG